MRIAVRVLCLLRRRKVARLRRPFLLVVGVALRAKSAAVVVPLAAVAAV